MLREGGPHPVPLLVHGLPHTTGLGVSRDPVLLPPLLLPVVLQHLLDQAVHILHELLSLGEVLLRLQGEAHLRPAVLGRGPAAEAALDGDVVDATSQAEISWSIIIKMNRRFLFLITAK